MLEYCAIDSPLTQPRNIFLGQLMGSVIGVAVSQGVADKAPFQVQDRLWLAGALSCGFTIMLMGLTGTVHPPAGATALFAVTNDAVSQLGWKLVPIVMMDCALMLAVSLLTNNLQRRFPLYWWTPDEVGSFWVQGRSESGDCEQAACKVEAGSESRRSAFVDEDVGDTAQSGDDPVITVTSNGVFTAPGIHLKPDERLYLEGLWRRL